jgi:hypothetical protein
LRSDDEAILRHRPDQSGVDRPADITDSLAYRNDEWNSSTPTIWTGTLGGLDRWTTCIVRREPSSGRFKTVAIGLPGMVGAPDIINEKGLALSFKHGLWERVHVRASLHHDAEGLPKPAPGCPNSALTLAESRLNQSPQTPQAPNRL